MDKMNKTMVGEEMQRIINSKEEFDKTTIYAIESMSEKFPKD